MLAKIAQWSNDDNDDDNDKISVSDNNDTIKNNHL